MSTVNSRCLALLVVMAVGCHAPDLPRMTDPSFEAQSAFHRTDSVFFVFLSRLACMYLDVFMGQLTQA